VSAGKPIIIAARRTAIGRQGGLHARRSVDQLASPVIHASLVDAGIAAEDVDAVIIGNAVGGGGNPARMIALAAGLPVSVPAMTIDTQCASGLDAIIAGARMIETGAAEIVIAGGVEAASTAPWRIARPANPYTDLPQFYSQPAFVPKENGDTCMIEAAENIARDYHISRTRQDAFALLSHRNALAAAESGALAREIVPLSATTHECRDEGPRASISEALLARMRPLIDAGTVTAGNSCQINDGAASAILVSAKWYCKHGSPPGLIISAAASAAIEPRILGLAAVPAAKKLEKSSGHRITDISAVELNDAFAAQALATADQLGLDEGRINTLGGALAYGHPYGASGAILIVRLFTRLIRQNSLQNQLTGLALIAGAGGIGTAVRLERAG
jgi:acetyl-CoA C-acetyltransferase